MAVFRSARSEPSAERDDLEGTHPAACDREEKQGNVEMLRFLPMRAYLAGTSLRDSLREREEGQALVEYALLLSLIAIVSIVILGTLGHQVSKIFSSVSNQI